MASGNEPMPYFNGYVTITDCNDAIIPGRTYIAQGSQTINKPDDSWFFIICFGEMGIYKTQLAVTLNSTTPNIYVRGTDMAGNWGAWRRVAFAQ